jgi:hypothetical protein
MCGPPTSYYTLWGFLQWPRKMKVVHLEKLCSGKIGSIYLEVPREKYQILDYQPPVNNTFLSEQINTCHQLPTDLPNNKIVESVLIQFLLH